MAKYFLPKIGDGTGGTITLAAFQTDLSTFVGTGSNALEATELMDARGQRVAVIPAKARKLFVVQDAAARQFWSTSDDPNALGNAAAPDWPVGGGGIHHLTHENAGTDEIDISALSGLLADPQAPLAHTHIVADTIGLQTVLDGKAAVVHSHSISDVTLLQTTLDAKAALVHTHTISDTTGLQTALDAKAALVHTHAQADVTGLVTALAGKSDVGHTHAASEVVSGVLAAARIATGTPDGTKFLRDDQVWTVPTPAATPFLRKPTGNITLVANESRHVVGPYDIGTFAVDIAAGAALEIT